MLNLGPIMAALRGPVDYFLHDSLKLPQNLVGLERLKSAQITVFIAILQFFFTMTIVGVRLIFFEQNEPTSYFTLFMNSFGIFFLYRIKYTGKYLGCKYYLLCINLADFPTRIYHEGGLLSPTLCWTFFLPLVAFFLISNAATLATTIYIIAIFAYYSVFPPANPKIFGLNYYLFNYIAMIITMAASLRVLNHEYKKYIVLVDLEHEKNEILKTGNKRIEKLKNPMTGLERNFSEALSNQDWTYVGQMMNNIDEIHAIVRDSEVKQAARKR